MKAFHIGDVLSVTTGFLVSPRHMDGVYAVLDFMEGDSLFTHQLPRAAEHCTPYILEQHPELADIAVPDVRDDKGAWVEPWVAEMAKRFGEHITLEPLPPAQRAIGDPPAEAQAMFGDRLIVVETPE